jgi:hypothetical protein
MDAESYYDILGIRPDADDEAVKQAYRERAKHFHPDRNPGDHAAELRFKLIGTAYDALKDAARRESYNEYLAFNDGREKSERRQWGRLFAVIALLLIGPSIVFFSVFSLDALSLFSDSERSAEAPKPSRQLKSAEGMDAVREAVRQQPPAAAPQPAVPQEAAPKREQVARTSAPAAPEPEKTQPAPLLPIQTAPTLPVPPEPPPSVTQTQPRQAPSVLPEARQPIARIDPFEGPMPGTPPNREDDRSAAARDPLPRAAQQPAAEPKSEGDAIASARLLARLKEPEGAQDQPAPGVAALPRQEGRGDTFYDCESCPLMAVGQGAEDTAGRSDVAVSMEEITVAEWNLCVRDGVCPPYPIEVNNTSSPVRGLTPLIARAYANWLSAVSGQEYRLLVSPPTTGKRSQNAENCDPNGGERSGFDWLEDGPRRDNCRPGASTEREPAAGFRVARKIRRQD